MRAVIARDFGDTDLLEVAELPEPELEPTQVLIEVRAAGVNPADVKRLRGQFGRGGSLPLRFGSEIAGVVVAVGSEVGHVHEGDEVVAYPVSGGMAKRVAVGASSVFPKPGALSWSEAAGLMVTGVTAAHAIEAVGLTAGDSLIVHGASGSVGIAVVQLAVARGATVVGTASAARQDVVASFGATPTTYGDGLESRLRELLPEGATAAIDTVGTQEAIDVSLALVADESRIASINAFGKTEGTGIKLLGSGPGADAGSEIRKAARGSLVSLAGAGELRVIVGPEFGLADARAAFDAAGGGHPGGKVVLLP